jgi:hypothetical protein
MAAVESEEEEADVGSPCYHSCRREERQRKGTMHAASQKRWAKERERRKNGGRSEFLEAVGTFSSR